MFKISGRHLLFTISLVLLIQTVWSAALPPPGKLPRNRSLLMSRLTRLDADTPTELHGKTPSSQVSGASIFWALLALALNAMAQPSAFDKGLSKANLLFPGHSSPIICFMDASDVI